MAFDPSTYEPGDAWTSTDFLSRAIACPRLSVEADSANDQTPNSFFEFRSTGKERHMEVEVRHTGGAATFSVVLERSFDEGTSWGTVKTYTNTEVSETIPVNNLAMWRLRTASIAGGTTIQLVLRQDT